MNAKSRLARLLPLICAAWLLAACVAPVLPAAVSPEAAGLTWRECRLTPGVEEWQQVEACLGNSPAAVWDDANRADAGERTERGHRLRIGTATFETRGLSAPFQI